MHLRSRVVQDSNVVISNSRPLKQDQPSNLLSKDNVQLSKIQTLEIDISMISINDDSQICRYFLPSNKDFMNFGVAKKFSDDVLMRRNHNRDLTVDKFEDYKSEINLLSFNNPNGRTCVLEILDNIVDQECSCQPLGSNFLDGTNVTIIQRNFIVDRLFYLASITENDRYSVQNAMAMFDRYLTKKGNSFNTKELDILSVVCWFIACKADISQCFYIDEICDHCEIKVPDLLDKFESEIITVLDFQIFNPTPILFLRPLTAIKQREKISHFVAKVLCELCTAVYEFAGHPSHVQACASYCLSMALSCRNTKLEHHWTPIIRFVTGLDIDDIRPLIVAIANYLYTESVKKQFPLLYKEHANIFDIVKNRRKDLNIIITGQR